MNRLTLSSYHVKREYLNQISVEQMLSRIIRSHVSSFY